MNDTVESYSASQEVSTSAEDLLAKLEEENRKLLENEKVPNSLPTRPTRTASSHSLDKSKLPKSEDSNSSPVGTRRVSSPFHGGKEGVFSSLFSNLLHQKEKEKEAEGARNNSTTSKTESPGVEGSELPDEYQVWGELLANWEDTKKRRSHKMKLMVRQGIPAAVRGLAWQLLAEAKDLLLPESYVDLLEKDSACEKQIRRDIARTFPEHDFFKEKDSLGQEALFNVMKAYSLHDLEVGYCQGSAFIVGLLLMQMPEEESFCMLIKLMNMYQLRELFKPSMPELNVCLHQLDILLQEHVPQLFGHFRAQGLRSTMYASSWFLTLFATSFPLHVVFRIMDCFLVEGMDMIFRIAVSLLQCSAEVLLRFDMEGMIKFLQNDMKEKFSEEAAVEELFIRAFELKINFKRLKKLGKDFKHQRERETEESAENRQLRSENQLLLLRIGQLEDETHNLATRLINGQVSRAEEAEEVFVLKREKAALHRQLEELTEQKKAMEEEHQAQLAMMENGMSASLHLNEDVDIHEEIASLRQRQVEMASQLATAHLRISELTTENVNCYKKEKALHEQVASLTEELQLLRQQLVGKSQSCDEESAEEDR